MDYFDNAGGDGDTEIVLPALSDIEYDGAFFVLDDGIAYAYETGDALALDDAGEFVPYADGVIFEVDDMDMEFLEGDYPAYDFGDGGYIETFGGDWLTLDETSGGVSLVLPDGNFELLTFDESGNTISFYDDAGVPYYAGEFDTAVIPASDGVEYVVVTNADGSMNLTVAGENYTVPADSPLMASAVAQTPGAKLPTTPGGTIDNFFALAASVINTFAQYKAQQNLQSTGAYRNTNGGFVSSGGQIVRANAAGVPIRATASAPMSTQTMMLLGGAALVAVLLLKR